MAPGHDGHNARNAVHGAFASPRAVGERRTHRHHEADVGGRQREFERGGHGDQQRRSGQVDRGADHVVGRAAVFHVLVFETARNALPEVFRDYALDACADVEGLITQKQLIVDSGTRNVSKICPYVYK